MFNVGLSELFVFAIIALLILGPEKLPAAIRALSNLKSKFEVFKQGIQNSLEKEFALGQLKTALEQDQHYILQLEKKLDEYLKKEDGNLDSMEQQGSKQQILPENRVSFSYVNDVQNRNLHIRLNQYQYFPVEDWPQYVPFQLNFLLVHLMNWRCFRIY